MFQGGYKAKIFRAGYKAKTFPGGYKAKIFQGGHMQNLLLLQLLNNTKLTFFDGKNSAIMNKSMYSHQV